MTMTPVKDEQVDFAADELRPCHISKYLRKSRSIQDLPLEILEYIISLLPPYENVKNCMLVCKTWQFVVQNVVCRRQSAFTRHIVEMNIEWHEYKHPPGPTISPRYTHMACRHTDSMYIFGGCASEYATFNDLWRFDLNSRQWIRPLAVGTYPPPKAYATFVPYKNVLILFGGWTNPSRYPIFQSGRLFNQVHFYELLCNNWLEITTPSSPPPMAGHSASVHGDWMIVFGGAKSPIINKRIQHGSNELWVFDLTSYNWWCQETTDPKPDPRFGQAQIMIDNDHILIIGGCGGPNKILSDVWLLTIVREKNHPWIWKKIEALAPENAATHLWCHPACKVDDKVVFLGKSPQNKKQSSSCPFHKTGSQSTKIQNRQPVVQNAVSVECPVDQRSMKSHDASFSSQNATLCSSSSHPSTSRSPLTRAVSPDGLARASKVAKFGNLVKTQDCASTSAKENLCEAFSRSPETQTSPSDQHSLNFRTVQSSDQSCSVSTSSKTSDKILCVHNSTPSPLASQGLKDSNNWSVSSSGPPSSTAEPSSASSRQAFVFRNTPMPSIRPNSMKNRQRQLEGFQRMEERIRQLMAPCQAVDRTVSGPSANNGNLSKLLRNTNGTSMCMYVLDTSRALRDGKVMWLPIQEQQLLNGPKETMFYSLVQGRGELIMFGGIQSQYVINGGRDIVLNRLYVLTGKQSVP